MVLPIVSCWRTSVGWALLVGFIAASPVAAQSKPEECGTLSLIVDSYSQVVQAAGVSTVNIGPIQCEQKYSPGMTGVRVDMEQMLLVNQVAVNPAAAQEIIGEFQLAESKKPGKLAGLFTFVVRDKTGERDATRRSYLLTGDTSQAELRELLGESGGGEVLFETSSMKHVLYADVRGDTVFAKDADGETITDFGVEIIHLPTNGDSPTNITPAIDEGYVFVDVPTDSNYAVRLINRSGDAVAVNLSIDGVNMFYYCDDEFRSKNTGAPRFHRYIVPAKKTAEVSGWWRNFKEAYRFRASGRPEEDSLEVGIPLAVKSPGEIGLITVQFFRAWDDAAGKPADARRDGILSPSRKETIPGEVVASKTKQLAWSWEMEPRATIALRYHRAD